jgi:periplasmic protein TonB
MVTASQVNGLWFAVCGFLGNTNRKGLNRLEDKPMNDYLETFMRRHRLTWLWALAGALGINLALFALMPHLQKPATVGWTSEQPLADINFIRIKRPDSEIKRKKHKPPDLPKPKPPPPDMERPQPNRLTLPFEINPRLPSSPQTLTLPPLDPSTFDTSGLYAFSAGDLDNPLMVLVRVPPVYPLRAKHRRVQGWVRIRFVVNEKGGVDKVSVVESKPPGVFDQNVIRCVSGWRFKPGTVEGMPVRAWAETTIFFKLE